MMNAEPDAVIGGPGVRRCCGMETTTQFDDDL
ncbi:hypothetical protein CGLO_17685 [Colletotrichum gloeosporioides Cg-14]|uniref:Uncharacterized protein n=1 Tax=Colletotrichum gloeosporioides (strain Cg-14) TaxID=1237896 RepID=T0L5T4_COLGC|nr:hypothetical protein CGLO_17685 [Colletotrichum gloeosporioides Cg-14]